MRFLCSTILIWLLSGWILAAPAIDIAGISGHQALGQYVDVALSPRDSDWRPPGQADYAVGQSSTLNFGYTQQRVWLRLRLNNPTDHDVSRVINIRYPLLDAIRLIPEGHSALDVPTLGRRSARNSLGYDHLPHRYFMFPITLSANTAQTFYMGIESDDSITVALFLTDTGVLDKNVYFDAMALTLYFGLVLANICFALFMLAILRERELLYYSGFLISNHLLFFAFLEGIPSRVFGFDSLFFTRDIISINVSASILLFSLFASTYLRFRKTAPALHRCSMVLTGLMCFALVMSFVLPYYPSILLSTVSSLIIGVFYGTVSIHFLRSGQQSSKRFLIAWSFGLIGAIIYGLKVWNLLPANLFTSYAWHIGTFVETLLFSFSIANRAADERKERLGALMVLNRKERELRVAQEQLLSAETEAKEDLELQVRERTRDLSRLLSQLETENQSLTELSINDGLTQVRNRRYFNDILPQMWQDAQDHQLTLSIMMLDVDHFKQVNDCYGHPVGDQCLIEIAHAIRRCVHHPEDVICRYGGEEFVIILPNTDGNNAVIVAEKIRQRIAEMQITAESESFHITASIGVAECFTSEEDDPISMLARCDEALYLAKRSGRNQVVLAGNAASNSNGSILAL